MSDIYNENEIYHIFQEFKETNYLIYAYKEVKLHSIFSLNLRKNNSRLEILKKKIHLYIFHKFMIRH